MMRLKFLFLAVTISMVSGLTSYASAENFEAGKTITVTGRLSLECTGTVYRIRQEWRARGDAVTEIETNFGISTSGSSASGTLDRTISVPLEAGQDYTVPIKVKTTAGKSGSATVVTTFWYKGKGGTCTGERTVASFIELDP